MRYLGGKKRQSGQIVQAIADNCPEFKTYCEPFCGAMWSATAVIKRFGDNVKYLFSDIHGPLVCFWNAAIDGWDPPSNPTEADWRWYNKHRPEGDPMTAYLGFAWSFGGKYFGGAARSNRVFKGSYKSTMEKISILRLVEAKICCAPYQELKIPRGSVVYLDPPYEGRTPQHSTSIVLDRVAYKTWAESSARRNKLVLATEFVPNRDWDVLYDYGDTVVRHLNAKPKDGTTELLMKVTP